MLVFLSWSGGRSKSVAEALESWLGQVIQAVEPWISSDINKGARWGPEIADKLERSKVGIICLTRDNLDARWILYEAGALSKTKDAYVCTLLIGLKPSDVEQPLAQFQHTTTDKEDIRQLLRTINKAVQSSNERSLSESVLDDIFETYWPRLKEVFDAAETSPNKESKPTRTDSELLREILELLRNQERRQIFTTEELIKNFKQLKLLVTQQSYAAEPIGIKIGDLLAALAPQSSTIPIDRDLLLNAFLALPSKSKHSISKESDESDKSKDSETGKETHN